MISGRIGQEIKKSIHLKYQINLSEKSFLKYREDKKINYRCYISASLPDFKAENHA